MTVAQPAPTRRRTTAAIVVTVVVAITAVAVSVYIIDRHASSGPSSSDACLYARAAYSDFSAGTINADELSNRLATAISDAKDVADRTGDALDAQRVAAIQGAQYAASVQHRPRQIPQALLAAPGC